MKYNRNTQNLLRYCLLTAVLLLYQIVSLCAAETALNTTIERNSSPSASLLPPPDTTHLYQNICDGDTFVYNGQIYDNTINEIIHLQDINGNDSVVYLHVFKNPSPTVSISANPNRPLCEGEDINITADCSCHILIFDQSFSGLSNYWKYVLRIPCGDLCPYPDAPSPPGPPGVIISCNENAPDNVEISTRGYTLQYFPYITNVYAAGMSVKLGEELSTTTETWVGSMTSSALDLSNPFKIIITAKGWGEEPGKITVCVDGIPQQSFYAIGNGWGSASDMYAEKILYFPAATSSSTITIKTDTIIKANGEITGYRAFIQRIQITRLCHHYSWSTGIADSNAIITVQPENNESYSVTVTNDNNCSASASYSVIVNHPLGTSDTISACNSYTWHDSTYMQSGTYYYTRLIADANGCYPVDTLHLTINDIPDAHISGNLNITEGHSTTLTVTPTGDQPYTYTWSASWSSGTSLSSPDTTNVFNTGVLNETTRYIVTVTDTNGCQDNDTATVNVTLCESWQLVTNVNDIAVGDQIVITNANADHALSTEQRNNNRGSVSITSNGNTITINNDVQVITIEQGTVDNTFAFNVGTEYLYAASSSFNYLRTQPNNNANGSWKIEIESNGTASIKAQGSNSRNWLRFHVPGGGTDSIHVFSCYSSGQQDVRIYKLYSHQSDTTVTACNSYTMHGSTFYSSGNYPIVLPGAANGCDSTIFLDLTILNEDAATVTFNPGNGTCDTNTLTEVDCQAGITLPTATSCAENYTFAGWTTTSINAPTSIIPTPLYEAGEHYNPSTDLTLYAVYIKCESEPEVKYKKVTSTPPNWNGDYLIVCEEKNVAFNGGRSTLDSISNIIAVTISENAIESNNSTDAAKFTIAAFNGDYSILSASGKFIGNPSNTNSLATQNTALPNSINLDNDGNINIIGSGGAYLRYNANSDQTRFRYFKSSTYTSQKAIQLYRKEELYNNCEYISYTPVDTIDMDTTVYICHYNCTGNDEAFCNLIFEDGLYDRSWRWRIWTDTEEFDTVIYRGGTYYHNYQLNGCHHVKRLVINQYEEDLEFALQEICQEDLPYHWESSISSLDTTFLEGTTSDVYVLYQSAEPCAMQMVLTLLVNNPIHTTINDTACNSYIWHRSDGSDTTITTSGHYTYSHEDINGCTQVDTLHIIIKDEVAATVSFNPGNGRCNVSELTEEDCLAGVTLPSATSCAPDYVFAGWTTVPITSETTDTPDPLLPAGSNYNPSDDITLYAVYQQCDTINGPYIYQLVTSDTSDWAGDYLIANTEHQLIWNEITHSDSEDAIPVNIINHKIPFSSVPIYRFIIENMGNGYYSIRDNNGYYMGKCSDNSRNCSNGNPVSNIIEYDNGNVNISVTTFPDCFITYRSDASIFGYYARNYSNFYPIQLYRLIQDETIVACTYTSYPFYPSPSSTAETCDSYTWHRDGAADTTITNSGTYLFSHTEGGCVYVDTLHLNIKKSSGSDTTVITCGAFEWHGQTYTESGNYKDTLTNAAGCDSIITLHLSITEVNISINASADTICAGEVDTLWVERVTSIAIGDILCTDNSFVKPVDWTEAAAMGKVALGIVFYVDNTGEHGWAVHLHNSTSTKKWTQSSYYADISLFNYPNAREAIKDLDGYNNTQRIRTASNNTQYPADAYPAVYAVDFEHGWYLPAAGQLRLLFAERHTINASLEAVSHTQQGVTPIADTFQYWSSTECNRDEAWGVTNSLGWVRNTSKNEYNRTCSVRNF